MTEKSSKRRSGGSNWMAQGKGVTNVMGKCP